MTPTCILATISLLCTTASAQPTITITNISVDQAQVSRGASFLLRVAAAGDGVKVGSYRIRTPYHVATDEIPEGFIRENGHAVYEGDGGAIFDNAPHDLDPSGGAIAVEISTTGWAPGTHYLVVFAHNRPAPGRHILDYRNLRLDVGQDTVRIRVLARSTTWQGDPVEFTLPKPEITAGEPLVCGARLRRGETGSFAVRLRPPYTWGEDEVLSGFTYYPDEKVGYVEDGPDDPDS